MQSYCAAKELHYSIMRVSSAFLERLKTRHEDLSIDTINLFDEDLPEVTGENIDAKYTLMIGEPIDKSHK